MMKIKLEIASQDVINYELSQSRLRLEANLADFANFDVDKEGLQYIYDKLDWRDKEKFINENLGMADDDKIKDEYRDRDFNEYDAQADEEYYLDHCSQEELFKEFQHMLCSFCHTTYRGVPMSKDKAMKIVEDMYNWMNIK